MQDSYRVPTSTGFMNVRLHAYLPQECYTTGSRIKVFFFYERDVYNFPIELSCETE
jgi:hypothetical protein